MTEMTWKIIDAAFQLVLLGATIALAVYTARMASSTKSVAERTENLGAQTKLLADETAVLARESIQARELADRHHQESLQPVLIVEQLQVTVSETNNANASALTAFGRLRNIGTGLATSIEVIVDDLGTPTRIRPLAIGDAVDLKFQVFVGGQIENGKPVRVIVIYRDQFGNEGRSEHFSKIGRLGAENYVIEPPKAISRS